MQYKTAVKKYKAAAEQAGLEALSIVERSSYERGGGWHLRAISPGSRANLTMTAALITPDGHVLVGPELAAFRAMRQRQAIGNADWQKTLEQIKQRNNCPDRPATAPSKPRPLGSGSTPRPERSYNAFERRTLLD